MGNTHMAQIARFEADNYQTKWESPDDFKWGYGRDRGPDNWWVYFPLASGQNQSPIDIVPEESELETDYKTYPLGMTYHRNEQRILENTGNTWQVNINESKSVVFGGPLKYKYSLKYFHMHWGEKDDCGSEHLIHNRPYSGELHFVHWNCEKYDNWEEASEGDDGLCILSVFVHVDNSAATGNGMLSILDQLENIKMKSMSCDMNGTFDIASMFPEDIGKYWSYKGSLSEPPCTENAIYVLFFDPITITSEEINRFRSLCSYRPGESADPCDEFNGRIQKNYRPLQHKGQRIITTSDTFNGQKDFQNQYMSQSLFQPMADFAPSFH